MREEVLHTCATRSSILHATRHIPPSSDSPLSRSSASFSAQTFPLNDRSLHPNGNLRQIAPCSDEFPRLSLENFTVASAKVQHYNCADAQRAQDRNCSARKLARPTAGELKSRASNPKVLHAGTKTPFRKPNHKKRGVPTYRGQK